MRLIDADALIAEYCEDCEAYLHKVCDRDVCGTVLMLADAPTIDAIPVVLCKECAWYREDDRVCTNAKCSKSYYGCRVPERHFCSYGERRDDDAAD